MSPVKITRSKYHRDNPNANTNHNHKVWLSLVLTLVQPLNLIVVLIQVIFKAGYSARGHFVRSPYELYWCRVVLVTDSGNDSDSHDKVYEVKGLQQTRTL